MNKNPQDFKIVSLVYSAPLFSDSGAQSAPKVFYNAFPELNDKAVDGSRTAFPLRAKYCLPLDSIFIPSGIHAAERELSEAYLMSLPAEYRSEIIETFKSIPEYARLGLPREADILPEFAFHQNHEAVHKDLAVTLSKLQLRSTLAELYTLLDRQLTTSGSVIEVPLFPDPNGSELQKRWDSILECFEANQIIDEAISLLVGYLKGNHIRSIIC